MHDYVNNELMHYGVLGMKWGVRRGSSVISKAPKTKRSAEEIDADIRKQRAANRGYKTEAKTYGAIAAGTAAANAAVFAIGFYSPYALAVTAVSAGKAAGATAMMGIGAVKVNQLKRELERA